MNIDAIRRIYPEGSRVELVSMDDASAPPVGTKGTVFFIDSLGGICVKWDNGSMLNVIYGVEYFLKYRKKVLTYPNI